MNAVGILGGYISRGVYTVSGTFHPFGGAVDIVVVEQQDGSFKSSPWYVRFGKFQGVLKTKEKMVDIIVNGVEANFQMYLDNKGEAYFLREADVEGESGLYPSFSGDEAEGKLLQQLDGRRILESKSCNYDVRSSIDGIAKSEDNGKIVMKTNSRRILGFVWGRRSIKEDHHENTPVARVDSLERAEIAADLLEVRWSTNIRAQKPEKSDSSKFSSIDTSDGKDEEKLKRDGGNSHVTSAVEGNTSLDKDCDTCSDQITNGSQLALEHTELSIEVTREMSSLNTKDQVVETSIIGEKDVDGTYEVKSAASDIEQNAKDTVHSMGTISENEDSKSEISLSKNRDSYSGDGETFIQRLSDETNIVSQVFNISEDKSEPDAVESLMFHGTSNSHVTSAVEGNMSLDKDCDTCSEQITNGSQLALEHTELSIEVTREISSLNTKDQVVETSIIGEKAVDGTYEVKSAARDIEQNAKDTVHSMGTISENEDSKSEISLSKNRDSYSGDGETFIQRLSDETNIVSQVFNISEDKSEPDAVESLMFHETSNSHVTSAVEGNMSLDKDCDTCSEQITNGSQLALEHTELSIEVTREMSSLNTKDQVVETSIIGEKAVDGTYEVKSAASDIEQNAKDTVHSMGTISVNEDSKSEISLPKNRDSYSGDGETFIQRLSDETNIVSQVFNISEDKSEPDAVESLMFHETSKSSMLTLDDSRVLTHKVSHLGNGGSGIVGVHNEGLHVTTEVHPEDTDSSLVAEVFEIETEKVEVLVNYSQQVDRCNTSVYEGNTMDQGKPMTIAASYTQIVSTEEMPGSVKQLKSDSIGSSFSSDFQDDKSVDESVTSKFQNSLNSIGNRVITKESNIMPSTNSDDEQFLFSDFDVSKTEVNGNIESDSQHYSDKEDYPSVYPSSIDEEDIFINRSYETCTSPDSHVISNQGIASPITILQSHPISDKEVERLAVSLPNMQAGIGNPIACEINHPLSHSVDLNSKSLEWMESCKDNSSSKSGGDGEEKVAEEQSKTEESRVSEELKSILPNATVGSPAEATVDPVGNWKLWPFSFKRSNSSKGTQSAVDEYTDFDIKKASDRDLGMDGEASIFKHKAEKEMVRSLSPTSEQLASLNLKEGGNTVTFTFYTSVLGKQEVEARIYLWKWNTRVVISDVDGTITKSDVLGQFMPFVGVDWSQTGVTNLFSAIKENGYQLLFLSARSISQAYHTRQFLFNLKQDGKALPEGPVVISPDGLFPSLYREVIRRAPHEFKIACLERIRELFPPDCNPFYAGFGNRETDEFSYLKVGIPKGKIFIINPKGEVVVNRSVDAKSYNSLHSLVNGMFPSTASSEQEDFNSWNYWKLPPPLVDF